MREATLQDTWVGKRRRLIFAGLVLLLGACGRGSTGSDAEAEPAEIARARALVAGAALPPRAEALAVGESVEALAVKEGAGGRAAELHALAARVFERVYRVDGKEQDAKEAVAAYDSAAKDLKTELGCDAALRGVTLAGDAAHDAQVTYVGLYKLGRRLGRRDAGRDAGGAAPDSPCLSRVGAAMASIEAFRPPSRILSAIEEGLAASGTGVFDAGAASAATPRVVRVEQWPGRDTARVVVTLNRTAAYRVGDEGGGGGAVGTFVELDGVQLGGVMRDGAGGGIVSRVRVEATTTGTRVTLDTDGGTAYRRVFHLEEPFRIVIDVARRPPGVGAPRRLVSRVVLDPGHGGNDAGASGPDGLKEKDVTLDIARRAQPIFAKAGIEAVLTRDDDRYVTLEERTARANQLGADLFVSIHCNAAENHGRHGVETYVLDTTRDEIASRVAARENATSTAATAELGSILANLRLADQATHSTHLAELLQKAAMASLRPPHPDVVDGGVHPAGFYVLVGARMPAVLFETSYISNPVEDERLESDDYKNRLADAIANAVRAYREGR